jgi:REP element-mobilizing transposase RayT
MDKFQNKYRIQSARLQNWDYGSNGAYFITICTQNREHFFGEIIGNNSSSNTEKSMRLNEIGLFAEKYWKEIPKQFPYVELGNFVVMPNHTHGILIINHRSPIGLVDGDGLMDACVETRLIASLHTRPYTITHGKNRWFRRNQKPNVKRQYIPYHQMVQRAMFV